MAQAKAKVQVENKTGIPALDAIIKATSTKFGTDLSGADYGDYVALSTGSLQLDLTLFIGGIPMHRIIEIIGDESSNKTSLCLALIAAKQAYRAEHEISGKIDLILDIEHSLTSSFIRGFGIDMDQVIWERPDTAEQALQMAIDYTKSGAIDMILLDSVDGLQNVKQQQRNVGEADVGGVSKDMNFAIRQISKLAPKYETTFLFINQIKMNPGVMFGSPQTTTGGRALQYYASLRLKCLKRTPNKDIPKAYNMRVKIIKTRCGPDFDGMLEIPFLHGKGFATALDVENVAKDYEMLKHSAGQTKVRWVVDPTDDTAGWEPLLPDVEKGKAAGKQAIIDNPWLLEKLRAACMLEANVEGAPTAKEILAMGPS